MSILELEVLRKEIQAKIWGEEKARAMIMGLCMGGCNWLARELPSGQILCLSQAGCLDTKDVPKHEKKLRE